jgi:hypothetical protein
MRRIARGMGWGILHGQWWTLWTVLSMFLWGHGSFDGEMVAEIVLRAFIFGFFGSLTGLIIGAANASEGLGAHIGVGVGVLLCLMQAALFQSATLLINLIFYYFTGRYVGAGIAGRVQQPLPSRRTPLESE